ncbi:MAG: hypothetical protein ACYC3I_02600 [Gemmataceae bacterium]
MLQDRYRQMLTAYVDGELSGRQRRYVVRLLRQSREARQLLKHLQADAQLLRRLPQPTLPADLSESVLRTISERRLQPGQRRVPESAPARVWMGSLVSWSAAAALLLGFGVGSYLYFAEARNAPVKRELAQNTPVNPQTAIAEQHGLPVVKQKNTKTTAEHSAPNVERSSSSKSPEIIRRNSNPPKREGADKPPPQPREDNALTERQEMFPLERVSDILPEVFKVVDLEREAVRKKLVAELRKDKDYRMELPCRNGTKAFDRVEKAARELHIRLILDKQAQEGVKLKKPINYALYLENITAEELARLVRQIGVEDSKSAAGKAEEEQIDRLVLTRLTGRNRKELAALLGIDPTTTDPSTSPTTTDAEYVALVLAYNPARPSPGSEEIKHFLEGRKPVRQGTIRVLLVLRG